MRNEQVVVKGIKKLLCWGQLILSSQVIRQAFKVPLHEVHCWLTEAEVTGGMELVAYELRDLIGMTN